MNYKQSNGVPVLGLHLLCALSPIKNVLGTGTVCGARIMEREDIVPGTQR